MLKKREIITFLLLVFVSYASFSQTSNGFDKQVSLDLIKRVLPAHAGRFVVEYIPQQKGKDVFELDGKGDKIILRGNNGVSVASALKYWLTHYAHCDISWNGVNLNIPKPFPLVKSKVRKITPHDYRHYFNYCTFSYTATWWDWKRWEWEIDFMALNGINMPLAFTGQNALWDRVYRSLGFGDKDMDLFFTGPAHFMWFWVGNIDSMNGPLPQSWMRRDEILGKKIIDRERALGMKPVLPAFQGHVPLTFKKLYPQAKLDKVIWEGRYDSAYILSPYDPMFQEIGDRFMKELDKSFGLKEHLYAGDSFNEMDVPHGDSAYCTDIAKAVYNGMAKSDSQATWVMQGWMFFSRWDYWHPNRIRYFLDGVPKEKAIILDLFAEEQPLWVKTNSFFGRKWIWCMLHNFGGANSMYGNLNYIAQEPGEMVADPNSGNMSGIGLVPEGIIQNPVIYAAMLENVWNDKPINLADWISTYTLSRYGAKNKSLDEAWKILQKTVYAHSGHYQSIIMGRPTFAKERLWCSTNLQYNPYELFPAWGKMLQPAASFKQNDCYQFDLVNVGMQVLCNYAKVLQQKFADDYQNQDMAAFDIHTKEFFTLIDDIDELMATRKELLLGKWLEDAKRWGNNQWEKDLYEKDARDILTTWGGGPTSVLHDYASKQWSGLFKGFYKKRWQLFVNTVKNDWAANRKFDQEKFDKNCAQMEWQWVHAHEKYPSTPIGNPVIVSAKMYKKYAKKIGSTYANEPKFQKN